MSIKSYQAKGRQWWEVDAYLELPGGAWARLRKRRIPTRERAEIWLAKARVEAFENARLPEVRKASLTVAEAWQLYEPVGKRDNDSWRSDASRAKHLVQHLGKEQARSLTQLSVDGYRTLRLGENTRRGKPPSKATLDREVELLIRVLGYAVRCAKLKTNPLAGTRLLREPNTRDSTIKEELLDQLLAKARELQLEPLGTILVVAYDTGMRKSEVCALRRDQLDLREGCLRLTDAQTKSEKARVVYLTSRAAAALKAWPVQLHSPFVFPGRPRKNRPDEPAHYRDPRRAWERLRQALDREDLWLHDLRRSFATNGRRRGIPESVIMKMGGWTTPSAFKRYNIVNEQDVKEAARALEAGAREELGAGREGANVTDKDRSK